MSTSPRTAAGGVALLLALTGGAYAVGSTMGSSTASADVRLPAFNDCDELTKRMATLAMPYVNAYGLGPVYEDEGVPVPMAAAVAPELDSATRAAAPPMAAGSAGASAKEAAPVPAPARAADTYGSGSALSAGSADHAVGPGETGTNLQEAGVDEPDIAKTDGRHVYSLVGTTLRIVDVDGDSPRTRGSLDLGARGINPAELLLAGDRLLVLGTSTQGGRKYAFEGDARVAGWDTAVLAVVDVADRDAPELVATEEITGRQVSARMTGNSVRVVLSSTPELSFRRPSGYAGGDGAALEFNRDVVRYAKSSDWLPSRTIVDGSGRISSPAEPLVDCADVRYPTEDSGIDMLSVLTVDMGRTDALQSATSTAVVTAGDLVYASPDRLYVATTQGGWGGPWRGADSFGGLRRPADDALTAVHEFDVTDPGRTVYRASGVVGGYIPGRWAMSEYQGSLRVVTTTRQPWLYDNSGADSVAGQSVSNIVVLRPRRDRLVQVGSVSGMGKGETVRAVRWFDELAAVVTFRQTDPLYLVDMSVPENPVVRGELKIPGYSAYLHPIGDHRLLGVGQDATGQGFQRGLQVSSFDVKDANAPTEVDKVTYGEGSSSPVETDARGFVYLPEARTAVLPGTYGTDVCGGPTVRCAVPAFSCPAGASCAPMPPDYYPRMEQGLISVRVSPDGRLTKAGTWDGPDRGGYGSAVTKVLSLPGGRLAALTDGGVTVLDADGLDERGTTRY